MKISTKNQLFVVVLFTILGFLACQSPQPSSAEKEAIEVTKPNLFLFLADDLSYNDLGVTGNPYVQTASIDAFAKNAIAFEKMYTPSAMCAPSRSALMTGLYPHRNGCHMNHGAVYSQVKSLPTYLKTLGYQVALVGKRHIKPEQNFPYDYVAYEELDGYLQKVTQPVCVLYASNEPHGPHAESTQSIDEVVVPAKWIGTKSTKEKLTGYYADIATLDKEFKQFLQAIEANNLAKNSVTIFTSDHGYEYFAKWSCYEAGLRIPFFMQANGLTFKAKRIAQLTNFVDIVPTFVELAGGIPPKDIDGKSLVPLLNGSTQAIHPYIYSAHTTRGIYSGKAYPIRSITDGEWKYITNLNHKEKFQNILTNGWNFDPSPTTGSWAEWLAVLANKETGAEWASLYQKRPPEELYYLTTDPNELVNLATETRHQNIKDKLRGQLRDWMSQQGDTGMEAELAVPLKARDMRKVPK